MWNVLFTVSLLTVLQILSEIVIFSTNSFAFINIFCKVYAENYLLLSPGTVSVQ